MCGQRDFNLIIMLNHTVISSVTVCTQSAIEQNSKKKKVLDVMGDSKVANFTCDSHYSYVITKNRVLLPCVKM